MKKRKRVFFIKHRALLLYCGTALILSYQNINNVNIEQQLLRSISTTAARCVVMEMLFYCHNFTEKICVSQALESFLLQHQMQ